MNASLMYLTKMHQFSACLFPIVICAAVKISLNHSMPTEGSLGLVLRGPACDWPVAEDHLEVL